MDGKSNGVALGGGLTVASFGVSIRGGVSGVSGWFGGRGRGCDREDGQAQTSEKGCGMIQ